MTITEKMGRTIRDNISLIIGVCMPLIVLGIGGTFGLVMNMQYQLGQFSSVQKTMDDRNAVVDKTLDRIWRTDRDQYKKIDDNAAAIDGVSRDYDNLRKRLNRLDNNHR